MEFEVISVIIVNPSSSDTPELKRIAKVRVVSTNTDILITLLKRGSFSDRASKRRFPALDFKYLFKSIMVAAVAPIIKTQNLPKKSETTIRICVYIGSSTWMSLYRSRSLGD